MSDTCNDDSEMGLKPYPDDATFSKHSASFLSQQQEQEVQRWTVAVGLCVSISAHMYAPPSHCECQFSDLNLIVNVSFPT